MSEKNENSFHTAERKEETPDNAVNAEVSPSVDKLQQATHIEEIEILGEQFQNYLLIAQALLKTLKRPRDIEICTILLRKVQKHNDSKQTEIRRNNNYFFRFYLRVLKWTSDNQPLELYQHWYRNQENTDNIIESRAWLEENKSHMSLKLLKDGSIVIYGAITDDPAAGWQDGGLNILAKRGLCSRNL